MNLTVYLILKDDTPHGVAHYTLWSIHDLSHDEVRWHSFIPSSMNKLTFE
jgi:hypothetical protein